MCPVVVGCSGGSAAPWICERLTERFSTVQLVWWWCGVFDWCGRVVDRLWSRTAEVSGSGSQLGSQF